MKRILFVAFLVGLHSAFAFSAAHSLGDVVQLSKKEQKALKKRYGGLGSDGQFFSQDQFVVIAEQNLSSIVEKLILHPIIKVDDAQDVIDYAAQIANSGTSFDKLEPRIVKSIDQGEKVFSALNKAIEREAAHQWRAKKVEDAKSEHGPFLRGIEGVSLTKKESDRITRVYAICIAPYENADDRAKIEPNICDSLPEYEATRHQRSPVSVREISAEKETPHSAAYQAMMTEAARVAENKALTTFERVIMAKCIAEQSLRFFVPSHHPLKALHKSRLVSRRAPEDTFFMNTGVCSNFSSIAYNSAVRLGLSKKIYLARHGLHVYLEFEEGGQWYHSHPFNSHTRCDITKFSAL